MTRLILYLLALLSVFLLVMLGLQKCKHDRIERSGRKDGRRSAIERIPVTDTVMLAKVEPIRITAPVVVPPNVSVSLRTDSVLRQKMERSTIIIAAERRSPKRRGLFRKRQGVDSLVIQTISPVGIISEARYPWRWAQYGNFQVDSAGRLHIDPALSEKQQVKAIRRERRKRRWAAVSTTAVAVAVGIAGFLIISR